MNHPQVERNSRGEPQREISKARAGLRTGDLVSVERVCDRIQARHEFPAPLFNHRLVRDPRSPVTKRGVFGPQATGRRAATAAALETERIKIIEIRTSRFKDAVSVLPYQAE